MPLTALDFFIRATDALVKFDANFSALRDEELDVYLLELQGAEARTLWDKVKIQFEKCLNYLAEIENADDDVEAAEIKYDVAYRCFLNVLASINRKLDALRAPSKMCTSHSSPKPRLASHVSPRSEDRASLLNASHRSGYQDNASFTSCGEDHNTHSLNLPPCDIDIFNGDFLSWPTFRDFFTAVYVNNSRISDIERLCHLLKKTSGEAKEIVSKFPLTHKSFSLAWKALKETYDNTRILVNHQLKLLFDLPVLDIETSSGLKKLQRGINGCISAMSIYDVSTEDWDPILVFLCLQRLPKNSVTLWEQNIKNKSALSSWEDLDLFLTERIQTLTCLRDIRGIEDKKPQNNKNIRSHFTNAATHKPSAPTSKSPPRSSRSLRASSEKSCVICPRQIHHLRTCQKFQKLSVPERINVVKRYHCCLNCLSRGHQANNCTSAHNCGKCNKRHHTFLHRDDMTSANSSVVASASQNSQSNNSTLPNSTQPSTSTGLTSGSSMRQVFHTAQSRNVLLGTAMVNIVHQGTTYPARALIDPASEASFITEHLQKQLGITTISTQATISGINQTVSTISRKLCMLAISSPLDASLLMETTALILPNISGNIPSFSVNSELTSRLPNLHLADSNLFNCRPVDLLLGADLYPKILLPGTHINILGSLIAQNTVFGWIITGPISSANIPVFTTTIEYSQEENLNNILLRFWELEEIPKRPILSASDKYCEDNYKRTTRRDSEGRYVVTLPLKSEFTRQISLGQSRTNCLRQFLRNEASLQRKPQVKTVYDRVVTEYLELGHMKAVSVMPANSTVCYLPHHPVINPEKQTSKLRVVFNASNKTSNGNSLNDILHVGPTLQLDLVLLILRWRLFRYVYNCDITQMYRQIRVDPAHTPLQRILFRDSPQKPIQDYELQTVTFGVNCAPYLAIRTLLQLADDTESDFPLAAHILRRCMYVDDVLTGYHDLGTALESRGQLINALSSAKFELRKWTSNDRNLLVNLPTEYLIDAKLLTFVEASSSKPLGIRWNAQLDVFYFNVTSLQKKVQHTKREALSTIAKLFDPLGWLGPVIVTAKIVMQKIWADKIGWDDSLLSSTECEWQKFVDTYQNVNSIQVPRWVHYSPDCETELHVFSDASEKAYAGVIYIRVITPNGDIFTHLLSCKTRVAPLKCISLPRLELCGAYLASELLKTIVDDIDMQFQKVYCWTDSTIVLAWLNKTPSTWTTFIANRVSRIQDITGKNNWHHVRSEDNPADLGSRGLSPAELSQSQIWWHGPEWLRVDSSNWKIRDLISLDTDVELRAVKSHVTFFANYEDILERFSSLDRALRVLSYVFRFFHRTHPSHRSRISYQDVSLTSVELKNVRLRLAVLSQKAHYAEEYACLLRKRPLDSKSSLLPLNPFLDDAGVLRLNGRLAQSPTLTYSERYPIIVPYASRFAILLLQYIHILSIHGGNQLMLRILRIEYWIPRLTTLIRTTINRCKRCMLDKKRSCTQIMAALPPERTVFSRPFAITGVDFAGPFDLKSFTGRACKITKGYVCVFVCFSTKAIHLEPTSDLSTATFLAAFHRFISRRSCPKTIFSDNGTNFVGASREIEREFRSVLHESRDSLCSTPQYQDLSWQFIPAGAPHMGGLWEAAVKSFKLHFRKHAENFKYTFEELSTILSRIEACLNSRPLCPMNDNPLDLVALTPGHFLVGSPILAPPEPIIEESPLHIVNRFRKMKALTQQFCLRWKEEYLKSLHKRYKWKFPQRDIQKDDLVVIRHEQLPPTSWKLGRVVDVHTGTDGRVRVADIKTQSGIIRRPIVKLIVLAE